MRRRRQPTLAHRVVMAWMVVVAVSNIAIGSLSYSLYQNQLLETRASEAENVARAMAVRIDGDKFTEIMETLEKNDYWHEVKEYADRVAVVFNTAFIYILDDDYTDEVTYFAEGAPDDAPFDLGSTEVIEGVYSDEMFETIESGESTHTLPYSSGDYGDMVSGFAPITSKDGSIAGVVGVDFYYEDIQTRLNSFAIAMCAIIAVFLVVFYYLMSYLGNKLAGKPLNELTDAAQQIAVGDMNIDLNIHSASEIGRLAKSFTLMADGIREQVHALETLAQGDLTAQVEMRGSGDTMGYAISEILTNLNAMFIEIRQAATCVSGGARQMSDSAQLLSQGANEQTDTISRLSSAISQVATKAEGNLEVAAKTNKLAATIKVDAQIGSQHMDKMTESVKEITDASTAIGKVIKVIDDIAFQTNILALNAAVEAARAGEHGKGFAVVAEEVRNLASKSAQAAKDTERLILDSMEKSKMGVTIAAETAEGLDRIIQGINECAELADVIASSFEEQIGAMKQIDRDVEQVSQVVQQNSAVAQQSAAASQEMSSQAETLERLVEQFKLKE